MSGTHIRKEDGIAWCKHYTWKFVDPHLASCDRCKHYYKIADPIIGAVHREVKREQRERKKRSTEEFFKGKK